MRKQRAEDDGVFYSEEQYEDNPVVQASLNKALVISVSMSILVTILIIVLFVIGNN